MELMALFSVDRLEHTHEILPWGSEFPPLVREVCELVSYVILLLRHFGIPAKRTPRRAGSNRYQLSDMETPSHRAPYIRCPAAAPSISRYLNIPPTEVEVEVEVEVVACRVY